MGAHIGTYFARIKGRMKNVYAIKRFVLMIIAIGLCGRSLEAASLKLRDIQGTFETDRKEINLIYRTIFTPVTQPPWMGTASAESPLYRSSSISTELATLQKQTQATSDFLGSMKSLLRNYFKSQLGYKILNRDPLQKITKKEKIQSELTEKNVAHVSPTVKFGHFYIKPMINIENIFNTNIETNIAFQSSNQVLEAELLKPLNQNMEFSIQNQNDFSDQNEHRVLFGLQYKF